jgi:hypothetical protein
VPVDQDALDNEATPVKSGDLEKWVKPLADGSVAVSIVNLGASESMATVKASDLGLAASVKSARDLGATRRCLYRQGPLAWGAHESRLDSASRPINLYLQKVAWSVIHGMFTFD